MIGGQVGIADHCRLEDGSIIGAQAGIPTGKTIRGGVVMWGTPARAVNSVKKQHAWSARLPELAERVRKLEQGGNGSCRARRKKSGGMNGHDDGDFAEPFRSIFYVDR